MSTAPHTFPGADPRYGYARPEQLAEMLDTVEKAARMARDELLDATDHVEFDGASHVLYALGELHKILTSAHELRDSFECTAAKTLAATEARYEREMAGEEEPSARDIASAEGGAP